MAGLHPYQHNQSKNREVEESEDWWEMHRKKQKKTYRILVEDWETDSSWWIDIRVEKALWEFAFGRLAWIVLAEVHR